MSARLASYDLLRKIAAGGMAEIFLARQWGSSGFFRDVVIKRLFPHLAEHERQLRMFEDEALLLSQLSHPNIPQVYDVGFAEGYHYIAMEYVEGLTIADLWRLGAKAGQVMPLNVALAVVIQTCEALHHAHERRDRAGHPLRIVHRDVTPHNIMVTRDGVVKLMDFGVAQTSARRDTEAGAVRGTFSYMAPEQVRGRPLDKRADVFAAGVLLYELTTGVRLFRGTDVQIMTAVVEKDVPPPSSHVPGYPEDLEEIVLTALHRERSQRLPSASHLTMYLDELAMRHGLLVGPRAIARYFVGVIPAEPILDASLGLVNPSEEPKRPRLEVVPDSGARDVWAPEEDADLPDIDEADLLDDLNLLSIPESPMDGATPPEPLALPDDVEDVDAFDDLTASENRRTDGLVGNALVLDGFGNALVLDGFGEDSAKDLPVVLLDDSVRKGKGPAPTADADYVRDLERRLAREED